MPNYSGVQKEVVVIASSSNRDKEKVSKGDRTPRKEDRQQAPAANEKRLPPVPPPKESPRPSATPRSNSISSESNTTPVASRAPSFTEKADSRSPLAQRRGLPRLSEHSDDYKFDDGEDPGLAISRVSTITQANSHNRALSGENDDVSPLGLRTSPQKKARQSEPGLLRKAGSGQNLRMDSQSEARHRRTSTADSTSTGTDEMGGGAPGLRTRSSSIKRLWRGLGNSMGGFAGAS